MPRDPFAFQSDDDNPLTLTRSPESQTSMASSQGGFNELSLDKDPQSLTHAQLRSKGANISARNDLHPYVQTLSVADVDSCVALENAAFPENERCSREKVRQVCICVSPVREMVLQWLGSPSRATAKLRTLTCVRASGIVRFNARECSDVQKRKKENVILSAMSWTPSPSISRPMNGQASVVSPLSLISSTVHLPPQRLFRTLPRPLLHFRPRRTYIIRTHLRDCASNQLSLPDQKSRFDCACRCDQMRVQHRH